MAQQPAAVHDAAPYAVDLQLSGHTHGGQVFPFNHLVTQQQPVVSGVGEVDGTPVYVTNGAGIWGRRSASGPIQRHPLMLRSTGWAPTAGFALRSC
jgi:predicted MPP superfamily phosphohydrolase